MDISREGCVIIGAGLAGASAAYFLAQKGLRRIVVLEQEVMAGMHSSGRNASMVRQVVGDPAIARLAFEGAAFLRQLPSDWPVETVLQKNGAFLLAEQEWRAASVPGSSKSWLPEVRAEWRTIEQICEVLPVVKGAPAIGGIWCPDDGVIDIHNLLQGYLRAAAALGAEVKLSSPVRAVVVHEKKIVAVQTESEEIACDFVVNAGGAWAADIGRMATALAIPLTPYRRHIFVTGALDWVRPDWPVVWDLTTDIYFRPESGGLLLSPCDETPHPPGLPPTDPEASELLAEKVSQCFPHLPDLSIQKSWAGLRTMTPDRRFVIGWDPKIQGFFWLAGLGGHGVTVSPAVGRLTAQLMVGEESPIEAAPFSPNRFVAIEKGSSRSVRN